MGRKKKIISEVEITDIVPEGKGLGRKDDLVIFVKNTIPGDIVDVLIQRNKSSYKEGIAIYYHKYSDLRVQARCKHFDLCGGCKWQNITYEQQLKFKQKIVYDAFERIAKVEIDQRNEILPSANIYYYRNKLEYTFSSRRWLTKDEMEGGRPLSAEGLGFHLAGMYDRIIDIEECLLQSQMSNEIRNAVRDFARQNKLGFYDTRNHQGFLRNLIIRNSFFSDEYMVVLVVGEYQKDNIDALLNYVKEKFSKVSSIYYIVNSKKNDSYADLEPVLFWGKKVIEEKMGTMRFKIGPKSFFQTNPVQAKRLYDIVLEYADLKGEEIVYDLYTGTGTIALYAAQNAKKVIGIEAIKEAIDDAWENAELNDVRNCDFVVGDMKDVLNDEFVIKNGFPDVVLLDPPRAGVHTDALNIIKKAEPKKIVYISCNPATQARDINILAEKYKVLKIQPVDMFPHTFHVENIALLMLK
jgi:23S rRNA (uracil1939-C5)-methyltransferase